LYSRQLPLCEPMIAPFNICLFMNGVNGNDSEMKIFFLGKIFRNEDELNW